MYICIKTLQYKLQMNLSSKQFKSVDVVLAYIYFDMAQ